MKPNPETLVSAGKCRLAAQTFGFVKVVDYRLYCLDGVNKVASAEWLDADDDDEAVEVAKSMMDGHDCELWQGSRLVARIPHQRKR
jgi:hypothetical protein